MGYCVTKANVLLTDLVYKVGVVVGAKIKLYSISGDNSGRNITVYNTTTV